MLISNENATDETIRLERTIGYPKDPDAFARLRDGLVNACNRHGVAPGIVISKCLELSKHCPTDFDLFSVAEGLREVEPWKPAPPVEYGPQWTDQQRKAHDARWQAFITNPANSKLAKGLVGLLKRHGAA